MTDEPGTGQAVQEPPEAQTPETQPLEMPKTSTSASRRVRARLARRMTAQRSAVNPVLEPLVAVHRESFPKADLSLLQKAYEVAEERHADQMRRSGDPYITIRWPSRTSWRNSAWTPLRWWLRCCTTPSRTPATRWRR
jgi:guanosine-3',5'-bis(diphosphate) 3'-pyrophosphohydrolase